MKIDYNDDYKINKNKEFGLQWYQIVIIGYRKYSTESAQLDIQETFNKNCQIRYVM